MMKALIVGLQLEINKVVRFWSKFLQAFCKPLHFKAKGTKAGLVVGLRSDNVQQVQKGH
jgi:hypothetical protein